MPWNKALKRQETRPELEDLKKAYRSVFKGEAGRMVLADLCTSLKRVQNAKNGQVDMADARAFQDGERSVALRILLMLED